ncbi:hypothetical protein A7985_07360 [Pseudoalteromonas luteoviolacea]|uniref:Uncharacterized protein n=1 Tax=Pseudoalteromonas luteoviolacea TaxID=43657 RepID=A0A1C0TWR3_9GAMM|nr:hypothetical protein [Pseudoalteromonas luteoviolacea]OCQ23749.1 hypothetical protein A7985_07360 [Pseudoalteromonas luteoviolacea]
MFRSSTSDYQVLFEFEQPWFVSDLTFRRGSAEDDFKLGFQVKYDDECKSIEIEGFNDLDLISNLLQSEKVVISRELNTQREFGTICIECWEDGSYSEFWCSRAEL